MPAVAAPVERFQTALARLPEGALPAPVLAHWREQAETAGTLRDPPDVLADTLGILATLNAEAEVLAAALLDAVIDFPGSAKACGVAIPGRLQVLLDGQRAASQVWKLHREHGGGRNPEGMRRLLLALVRDLRVVPVVLARQLARMRAAWRLPAEERRALARLTRDIHAPLANRLGIWQLKWELEDLAFRELDTETYLRIARLLDDNRSGRERWIEQARQALGEALSVNGIAAEVAGRPKHIYSIWRKMRKKDAPIGELYDLRALRVLVDDVPACYAALGTVHALWTPLPGEFDDYIARPKRNDYRSLHTAVVGPGGKSLEVQIRTREMHAQAELGVAAHWRYKEGGTGGIHAGAAMDKRIAWMRQLLEQAAEAAREGETSPLGGMDSELVEDRVYALTPKGEVIDLQQGATVLDFAYQVHTEVGHRCRGAKVDGRIVPLTYQLHSGDRVEILTAKTAEPRRDWLQPSAGFLASSRSRDKVRAWFNKLDRARNLQAGRELLDRDLRRLGLLQADLQPVLGRFNVATVDELLVLVALGDVGPNQVGRALLELERAASQPPTDVSSVPGRKASTTKASARSGIVTVQGVDNLLAQVARCCQPLPGEEIIGYLTRARGVSVHRPDCASFIRLAALQPARAMPVEWGARSSGHEVELRVEATDRKWLLKDITTLVAQLGVQVLGLHADQVRGGNSRVRLQLRARVADFGQLGLLLGRIEALPGGCLGEAGLTALLATGLRLRDHVRRRWQAWPRRRRTAVGVAAAVLVFALLLVALFGNSLAGWLWPGSRSAELRQLAERALEEGRLTADDGSGARELFDAALAVQPDQVAAREGLARVGRAALEQAARDIARGRQQQAHAGLRLARELEVPRARIEPLEAALRARESTHAGIDVVLARADSALAAGQLEGIAGALPLYQRVLAVQPRNQRAVEGREDALTALLQPASAALQAGDVADLESLVRRAELFDPGHVALPDLRAGLSRLQTTRQLRLQRLVAARQHVSAATLCAQLRTGAGDQALPAACTNEVVAGLLARARVSAGDFDFASSERWLALARDLAPAHPRLAATERQLVQARLEASKLPRPPPGTRRVAARVAGLLADAARAQARGDWLTPPGESAWDKLRAARALAPDDRAVLRALAGLKPAARECHADALRDNSLRAAQTCLDVWRQVDPDDADLPAARRRLAERWIAVGDERLQAGELESAQRALLQARAVDPGVPGLEAFSARLARAQPARPLAGART